MAARKSEEKRACSKPSAYSSKRCGALRPSIAWSTTEKAPNRAWQTGGQTGSCTSAPVPAGIKASARCRAASNMAWLSASPGGSNQARGYVGRPLSCGTFMSPSYALVSAAIDSREGVYAGGASRAIASTWYDKVSPSAPPQMSACGANQQIKRSPPI